MTIKEFVEEARKIHGDKYDYKSVDFIKKLIRSILFAIAMLST